MSFELPDEAKTALCFGVAIALVISAIAIPVAWYNLAVETAALKAGLVQRTVEVPGSSSHQQVWVKADAEAKP